MDTIVLIPTTIRFRKVPSEVVVDTYSPCVQSIQGHRSMAMFRRIGWWLKRPSEGSFPKERSLIMLMVSRTTTDRSIWSSAKIGLITFSSINDREQRRGVVIQTGVPVTFAMNMMLQKI